jgi:hypothetical protein
MENKELPAARNAVGALNLEEDPVVAAQARVDNFTGILAHLLDDDDATLATLQLARERISVALALLESLLKMRAARTTQSTLSGATQVDFRDKRPPEIEDPPDYRVSTTGEPFDLPDYLSQVERHWTANMFSRNLCLGEAGYVDVDMQIHIGASSTGGPGPSCCCAPRPRARMMSKQIGPGRLSEGASAAWGSGCGLFDGNCGDKY